MQPDAGVDDDCTPNVAGMIGAGLQHPATAKAVTDECRTIELRVLDHAENVARIILRCVFAAGAAVAHAAEVHGHDSKAFGEERRDETPPTRVGAKAVSEQQAGLMRLV